MLSAVSGNLVRLHFTLFQEDGITPLSGLDDTDFAKRIVRDDTLQAAYPSTVTEVAATGIYYFDYTPDVAGDWYVEITQPDVEDVFTCLVMVGDRALGKTNEAQLNVAYDESITTLFMEIWLDRNGESVIAAELVSCSIDVYDDAAGLLFSAASATPDANGRFSLLKSPVTLSAHRPYNATVTVVDTRGSVTTFQAFTTVG